MEAFWRVFVPLFVAVDALGFLPIFIGLTRGLPQERIRRVALESVMVGSVVAFAFFFAGTLVLRALGVGEADFMVAGA